MRYVSASSRPTAIPKVIEQAAQSRLIDERTYQPRFGVLLRQDRQVIELAGKRAVHEPFDTDPVRRLRA